MNTTLLDAIEKESKKDPKHALLRQLGDDTLRFLKLVCDPLVTFGVTVDEDVAYKGWTKFQFRTSERTFSDGLYDLCIKLRDRDLTGNSALNQMDDLLLAAPSRSHLKWACRFLNKKLRAGFTQSTLNKIWPGLINVFKVSLAEPYDPDKHELVGDYFFEPKLDGLRMILIGGKAYTRNGHQIESVDHIIDELRAVPTDLENWVLDGEVMGVGDFDEASGNIRRKGDGSNEDIYYNVFDILSFKEWTNMKTLMPLDLRKIMLVFPDMKYVRVVPSKLVTFKTPATGQELCAIRDEFIAQGYEGGMGKKADAPYVWKRSDDVLKFKKMETIDAPIVGFFEGKGRHKGRLGGIYVDIDGVQTKVGSGFSDSQRDEIWAKRDDIDGLMVEVQYQNKTKDGRLRFPVFIKFRPDKD